MEYSINNRCKRSAELHSLRSWFKRAPVYFYYEHNNEPGSGGVITCNNHSSHIGDVKVKHQVNKITERNVFEHWKMYVVHKLNTRKGLYEADKYYHKKLQTKVLNALLTNMLLNGQNISASTDSCIINNAKTYKNYSNAKAFYARMLLRLYFKTWSDYIVMKRKEKILREKIKAIWKSYNLKKCMEKWKKYVAKMKRQGIMQSKTDMAQKFHQETLLRKYVKVWCDVCVSPCFKMKIGNANAHYKVKLLKKYFSFWKTYCKVKMQKSDMRERIRHYIKMKLLKQYFDRLIRYTRERINYKEACEQAKNHYESKLRRKSFFTWREWCHQKLQEAVKVHKIQSILKTKILRLVFLNWQSYIFYKKCRRRKAFSALRFYQKKLLIFAFKKLESYVTYRKQKKDRLAYLRNGVVAIVREIQNVYIQKWREALYTIMREKCKFSRAIEFRETSLLRKYLYRWKHFSQQYRTKILRKKKLHELTSNFVLKKFVIAWHTRLRNVMEIRKREQHLISTIRGRNMKTYFLLWKKYANQKINEKTEIEAAKLFHKKLLLRDGLKDVLKNTLRSLDCRYDMELEDITIRSVQNFEILRMYFHKWQSLARINTEFIQRINKPLYKCTTKDNMQPCRSNTYLMLPEYIERKDVYFYPKFPCE